MKGMTFQQQYAVSFFEIATYCCQNETEVFSYIEYCGLEPKLYLGNSQFIIATHSPILLGIPGADIEEVA